MKLAILSDIHGNKVALEAVLSEARKHHIEHLIVLGDLIGYYYDAIGVLTSLRRWPITAIGGNHERLLAKARFDASSRAAYRWKYGSALEKALGSLSSTDLDWLTELPSRLTVELGGMKMELCHGSPRDPDEYVYPDAPTEAIEACHVLGRDAILLGHTHYPFFANIAGAVVANPGSVGQARDRGGAASWCRIDTQTRVVVLDRTPYDVRPLAAEVRRYDPHLPYLATVLERGNPALSTVEDAAR